jgi:hypothetical protein
VIYNSCLFINNSCDNNCSARILWTTLYKWVCTVSPSILICRFITTKFWKYFCAAICFNDFSTLKSGNKAIHQEHYTQQNYMKIADSVWLSLYMKYWRLITTFVSASGRAGCTNFPLSFMSRACIFHYFFASNASNGSQLFPDSFTLQQASSAVLQL